MRLSRLSWRRDDIAKALAAIVLTSACSSVSLAASNQQVGPNLESSDGHRTCASPPVWTFAGKVLLEPGCIFTSTVNITNSDTELDCQGSVIDPGSLSGYALHIDSQGRALTNVTVRNCIVRNANAIGIVVGWRGSDQAKVSRYERDEIYDRTPHFIQIINTRVEASKGAGIYLDDYVSDVTLRHVAVTRSDSMAIYLEHSSRRITIEDSLFEGNSQGKRREALAIDSSAHNVIRRNIFRRNKAGGIFLYKNCHEHAAFDAKQTERWQGSDNNLIEDNHFEDEPVGVWIGSRQSLDLRKMRCGDPYYGGKFVRDKARENTVRSNSFLRVSQGVLIEDDYNDVVGNRFQDTRVVCIRVGSPARSTLLGQPVVGVNVKNNFCDIDGSSDDQRVSEGIEFVHGSIARR
jgi:hypothetical protein